MSYTTVVLVVAASWLSAGLTLSLVMGRLGHDAFSWLILGARLGRLTLATVIPYDSGFDRERDAKAMLEHQGAVVGGGPRLELLHGRPAPVLLERAVDDGYDLLVIGTRGAGASKVLLGSTAVDVAEWARVPVLLMGAAGPVGAP